MYFMKTRFLILMIVLLGMFVGGCHEIPEGFLETGEANYNPDTLIVRKTLDPKFDEIRMENGAPWVSIKMEGYLGTEQINFSIESVTSEGNEAGAAEFMKNLSVRGAGAFVYPQGTNVPEGRYVVSVRLTNPGYSQVVKDCFTFIVKD